MNSEVSFETPGGRLTLSQQSDYPWAGQIRIEILNSKAVNATICVRMPGWARNQPVPSDLFTFTDPQVHGPTLLVNEQHTGVETEKGYISLEGKWKKGDKIELTLPMGSRVIAAHKNVEQKTGLRAVQFGPVVYCAEEMDNTVDVLTARISRDAKFIRRYRQDLLGGVNVLEGEGMKLIPYYAWANREIGKMNVWFGVQ
jgi:DUF1680 family protein